ncbi:MAG: hypothetical protein O2799_09185 [Planctomycetota bacterium]|nr:hypothetical protein [Planctomycetota bacterium]
MSLRASLYLAAAALTLTGAAQAQDNGTTATLLDGTVLTVRQPLETWGVEGPIWKVDPLTQEIFANGHNVKVPATIDGAVVGLEGTSDGAGGAITAASFDRLLDENAQPGGRDANPGFPGAVRSLYASDRFQANADGRVVGAITNHFTTIRDHANTVQPGVALPTAVPAGYPAYSGGTCKSAGHVYEDGAGNPYFIPDLGLVIELAENVAGGSASNIVMGATLAETSFMIGDLVCVMNPDPRFPIEAIGAAGPMEPMTMLNLMVSNPGLEVAAIGYLVGEGHMMVITLENEEIVDPTTPPSFSANSWSFRDDRDEIRFRGFLDKPTDAATGTAYGMRVTFLNAAGGVMLDRAEDIQIDPLTGLGEYRVRSRDEVTTADIDRIEVYATLNGAEVPETRTGWDRIDVE